MMNVTVAVVGLAGTLSTNIATNIIEVNNVILIANIFFFIFSHLLLFSIRKEYSGNRNDVLPSL